MEAISWLFIGVFFVLAAAAPLCLLIGGAVYAWRKCTGAETGDAARFMAWMAAASVVLIATMLAPWPVPQMAVSALAVLGSGFMLFRAVGRGVASPRDGPVGSVQRIGSVIGLVLLLMFLVVVAMFVARDCGVWP